MYFLNFSNTATCTTIDVHYSFTVSQKEAGWCFNHHSTRGRHHNHHSATDNATHAFSSTHYAIPVDTVPNDTDANITDDTNANVSHNANTNDASANDTNANNVNDANPRPEDYT